MTAELLGLIYCFVNLAKQMIRKWQGIQMKIWVDDVRPAPEGYLWLNTVNKVKNCIVWEEQQGTEIEIIDIDHDAGVYAVDGDDYIKLLDWLEETGRNYPIHIHSMNPVGVENMRRIIKRNGWKEVR